MNNIQRLVDYFLDQEALNVDHDIPIICLGREYSAQPDADRDQHQHQHQQQDPFKNATSLISSYIAQIRSDGENDDSDRVGEVTSWPSAFVSAIEALYYLSYRTEFPLIPRSASGPAPVSVASFLRGQVNDRAGFTSDVGWGCMVRSGQTLLANALGQLRDGTEIVTWFADDPRAPFSIHNFVYYGQVACKKLPGEWFGPSAAARCMSILCSSFTECGLRVYISSDAGDVYEDSFKKIAAGDDGKFRPTLLLVGIRLGIEKITPVYHDALKVSIRFYYSSTDINDHSSLCHFLNQLV